MTLSSRQQSSTLTTPTWMRWMPIWHGFFYVSLVLVTVLYLVEGSRPLQHIGIVLGISLMLGLWYGICVVVSPSSWEGHPLLAMGYLAIGWSIWFGLTKLDPVYLFVLVGLYPQVFVLPPLPGKILGAILLTALVVWRQVTLTGGVDGYSFLTLAGGASGIVMALFIHAIVNQSQQRQRLIGELETTRQALATAVRQAGIVEERQRIAHEIHDTLAQGFTSIVMQLEAAEASHPHDLSTLQRHLDSARRTARENLSESRRLLWALQPAILIVPLFQKCWSISQHPGQKRAASPPARRTKGGSSTAPVDGSPR